MTSTRILCVLAFFIKLNCISASETYKSIIWDPQNPLFVDGKSNCDPAYKHKLLKIRSASKIKFICPNVATVMQTTLSEVSKSNKYENLWLLYDKTSFEKCDTKLDPNNITQPLLRCTEPTELEFHSITFQPFAAEPNELTFHKGESYYFIATSNGLISHINDTSGGHCNDTANNVYMKIEVYVCNSTEDPKCESDVGELVCPKKLTVSSSTTPTPTPTPMPSSTHVTVSSTPSEGNVVHTVTYTLTTTVTVSATAANSTQDQSNPSEANNEFLKSDSNNSNEKAWMAGTFVLLVLFIALVLGLIIYHFFCGKKKCRAYEHRIDPSLEIGEKNRAFKDNAHGKLGYKPSVTGVNNHAYDVDRSLGQKPSIAEGDGSLPRNGTDLVIYNQEVFYNKAVDEREENEKNAST
ncbi:hypothetical protein ACROYT_G017493 [Oculina patagonica]